MFLSFHAAITWAYPTRRDDAAYIMCGTVLPVMSHKRGCIIWAWGAAVALSLFEMTPDRLAGLCLGSVRCNFVYCLHPH
jgi:hypothetical protein